jgi:hypothetical protein
MTKKLWILALLMAVSLHGCGSDEGSGGPTGGSGPAKDAQASDLGEPEDVSSAGEVAGDIAALDVVAPQGDVVAPPEDVGPADAGSSDAADLQEDAADVAWPDTAPGDLSCKAFYAECVAQCPKGTDGQVDPDCFEACRATLSASGEADLDAMLGCTDAAGCADAADGAAALTCFADACLNEYLACFHGEASCTEVLQCMGACPEGEENGLCVLVCSQEGTPEAQQHLFSMLACAGEACCPGDAATCQTPDGQACSKAAFEMGGECFGLATQCLMGTY